MDQEPISENLVVYKLGQIESLLSSMQVRMADRDAQYHKDFAQLEAKFDAHAGLTKTSIESQDTRIKALETKWDMVRNWAVGVIAVFTAIAAIGKAVLTWLK